uniref:Probable protein-export membrane protein SecG n=1 Tax=Pyramimonas obovata TaxID=1411642 RepID=A0A7S0N3V3_9CHLO|mmetsp:Transcript_20093/g.43985  ORF Transcript_20093/g.43985 Transcript_20093/m.43985 type:complete len:155 (+) Transcript_20093:101-565(+)|eukprot:CAMPEP_0118920732 /NCGR_PEP_ID=MMETSP1169-20130426/158_1 /TAXON_ID=36882 /ORGANISM="Pyramimonas obovata, Strain CCMP722" /LENGTH=154 /DNA_ID=CAMNT_0006861309 /DNA_START=82 /DNA_END=546 /DNA_ORIENTATION=-
MQSVLSPQVSLPGACTRLGHSSHRAIRCTKALKPRVHRQNKLRISAAAREDRRLDTIKEVSKVPLVSSVAYLCSTPAALAATDPALQGVASTLRTVTAGLAIALILLQNPQSNDASEALAKGQFGSMKQSTNFLNVSTWVVIGVFIASSAVLAL